MLELDVTETYESAPQADRPLIIACGAIATELVAVLDANKARERVEIQCLPAIWHNRPERIPGGVKEKIEAVRLANPTRSIFVAYADCGSGGMLDRELAKHDNVERLPGAHCYAFFAGLQAFDTMMEQEIGTFFLTDYLARHFQRLIWDGMGLTAHPELKELIFGHYTKVTYLAQQNPAPYVAEAQAAADLICGGKLEIVHTGYGLLETITSFANDEA